MKNSIENLMPVGAPWGGPEGFKFLSCFASLYMRLEKEQAVPVLYCDHDIRVCNQCNECGEMIWDRKCHEQIYHDFLTLSGVSCYSLWPDSPAGIALLNSPAAFTDDAYIQRTMDFAGYTYRLLEHASEAELKDVITRSIDCGIPVLAYLLVNDDWCLVSGYADNGETLLGGYVPEDGDDPSRKPDRVEDGVFSKSHWYHERLKILLVTGKKAPRQDYGELFAYLKVVLQHPGNTFAAAAGLAAFDACKAALLDKRIFRSASKTELEQLYRLVHVFIGVLAEARCFASFAFFAGFFGRIKNETTLADMMKIGEFFMDTHNQCWGAWTAMGKDYQCQPELYLEKFCLPETRVRLAEYIDICRANDEKAIHGLEKIYADYLGA